MPLQLRGGRCQMPGFEGALRLIARETGGQLLQLEPRLHASKASVMRRAWAATVVRPGRGREVVSSGGVQQARDERGLTVSLVGLNHGQKIRWTERVQAFQHHREEDSLNLLVVAPQHESGYQVRKIFSSQSVRPRRNQVLHGIEDRLVPDAQSGERGGDRGQTPGLKLVEPVQHLSDQAADQDLVGIVRSCKGPSHLVYRVRVQIRRSEREPL
mmetsp:Transcript_83835/g.270118  ORF Transcript_83835/g.270118 Transcript_83835/m.270118 type:complete len:214 (-) Transcript_83835:544-1185(-)